METTSKITELNRALAELNKKLEELQSVFYGYKTLTARISQGMHESLGIFLDKVQSVVEMAYHNNADFQLLEKISAEILGEIHKLILLKGELWSLSGMDIEFMKSQGDAVKGQPPVKPPHTVTKERSDANVHL